jgi:hypothetical protein
MHHTHLIAAVAALNGASFIGLDTCTVPLLKGGAKTPHKGRITKMMTGASLMAFQNKNINGYEAMIERRLKAEGKDPASFVLGPRMWGTRVPNMPIVEHTKDGDTQYYLEVIFLKPGRTQYMLDGLPIAKSDIIGLQEVETDPLAQGALDDKVIIRCFKSESITELRIDGKAFR